MQGSRNILVGVDLLGADRPVASGLKPPTEEAVLGAIWLAGQVSAELTFLSVLDIPPQADEPLETDAEQSSNTFEDDANQILGELVAQAKEGGVEAKSRLAFGKDWVEIIRQVLREKHDLVVIGTRDRSEGSRPLLGSTCMKLLRKCPCSVWITRPETNWDELNMLVATDLTQVGEDLLHLAVNGAQLLDAKVRLLHAVELDCEKRMLSCGLPEEQRDAFREQQRTEAEQRLYGQLSQTDWRTLTYGVLTHVVDGPADAAILKAIEEYDSELLVMGTIARQDTPGVLIGNTAERILPEVNCSVLAIKPDGFQCPITLD